MISRSFFRQSAAFLWLSLCILTDSTPRMACNAQHPADGHRRPALALPAPAPPARRRTPRRPDDLHHLPASVPATRRPRHAPGAAPASRPRSTIPATRPPPAPAPDGRGKGEGERGRREEQGKTAQPHAVKVIYTEPTPHQHRPSPGELPAVARPAACSALAPVVVQFCFWRVCRTPAP